MPDEPKSAQAIWRGAVNLLGSICNQDDLQMVDCLELRERPAGKWVLLAPNQFVFDYIATHNLSPSISMALAKRGIKKYTIAVDVPDLFSPPPPTTKKKAHFESNLDPDYHFDNFVAGPSNDYALAAAKRVAQDGYSPECNPLVIYAGSGMGKSHLLHAIGNELRTRHGLDVLYINAQEFIRQFVQSITDKKSNFAERLYSAEALIIDDVQFLGGTNRSQVQLFNTFNDLTQKKCPIVLASDCFPREIEGLEDRLKSRFGAGLNVSITFPELETRIAILQKKAQDWNFDLPHEVCLYIANNVISNVRELEGALRKIIFIKSQMNNETITLSSTRLALRDFISAQNKNLTVENIQSTVAGFYKLQCEDLLSKSRKANIALARQMAMFLARELTSLSLQEIGLAFQRDHSTIIHACQRIKELQTKAKYRDECQKLRHVLTN